MRITLSVTAALLLFLLPVSCHAGAWAMNQGGLYTKLSCNRYVTDSIFGKGGGRNPLPNKGKFYDNNVTFYGEYGLTDRVTLSASLPYKSLRSSYWNRYEEDERENSKYIVERYHGFGDAEFGLKYGLFQNPFVGSVQFLYKNAGLYTSREKVMPGNNQSDYEIRLLGGKSLWPFPGYCGVEAGYRFRTKAPSDEFKYLLEFGMDLTKKLSLRLKLDGTKSMHNARRVQAEKPATRSAYVDEETGQVIVSQSTSSTAAAVTNPSLGLEYDLGKFETTLNYKLTERWSGEVSLTTYPYGKNISPGRMYSIGIVYYFENKKS